VIPKFIGDFSVFLPEIRPAASLRGVLSLIISLSLNVVSRIKKMQKILVTLKCHLSRLASVVGLLGLVLFVNLILVSPSYAAVKSSPTEEKVIQPFELSQPASDREEAYEKVAKVVQDPTKLIKAENEEVKAEIDAYKKDLPSNNLLEKATDSLEEFKK
jgi:hypothetical protein